MPIDQGSIEQWRQFATPTGNPPVGAYLVYFKADGFFYKKDSSGGETRVDQSSAPANMATTDTTQTISGGKTFTGSFTIQNGLGSFIEMTGDNQSASSGTPSKNSNGIRFYTRRWDGAASQTETIIIRGTRGSSAAGDYWLSSDAAFRAPALYDNNNRVYSAGNPPPTPSAVVPDQPGAPASPVDGQLWYDNDDPGPAQATFTPPAWQSYTPTLTNFTASAQVAHYVQFGKTVHAWANFTVSSTSGVFAVSLPVAAAAPATVPIGTWSVLDVGTARYNGTVQIKDANTLYFFQDGTIGSGAGMGNTTPMTWSAGDGLAFSVTYEAA